MLDMKNFIVDNTTVTGSTTGNGDVSNVIGRDNNTKWSRVKKFVGQMNIKAAAYLRLTATKNAVNRFSDYHYLVMAVQDSTAPINDLDYIHPVLYPHINYATSVITKGLCPNGQIDFEFVPDRDDDDVAARQATEMVSAVLNNMNDAHEFLREWVQDTAMHKNGMLMIIPVREKDTRITEVMGTLDQLRAFEIQAEESGLKVKRQSRRKVSVDMKRVIQETQQDLQGQTQEAHNTAISGHLEKLKGIMETGEEEESPEEDMMETPADEAAEGEDPMLSALKDSISRNTTYKAKYKLTGYKFNIRMRHIAQHYWVCDPNVKKIQDQPFCGFYDPMTIQQATELYPELNEGNNLEKFRIHAEYNQNGAFQAGSVLNNLAIHGRDSVPTMGIPVDSGSSADPDARHITIFTCWDRYDIDGDGELELIEVIFSGSYVISAKEVEFIPVANMCHKPLPGNFFGTSIAEMLVPMQEYMTSMHRAEIQLGLLQSTARIGVNPAHVDFEEMMDGEAAIFILDSKFDPNTSVWEFPVPQGNIQFIEPAMQRMQQDAMAMIGMTTPQDTFNPEVMDPGNSGIKLQLAMGPNQLIQDDTIKNASSGLKEAIWLVWRTLIQYADDYGVKKLAQANHPDGKAEFLDAKAFDDFNFCERKEIHVSLALGMNSEENALNRLAIIKQTQMELYQKVEALVTANTLTPEMWKKIKKPYEDTLYTLSIKDPDSYLPTDQEVAQMIKQSQEAQKNKQPTPDDQNKLAQAKLNDAKAQQVAAEVAGLDATSQMDWLALAMGDPKVYTK